MNFQVFLFKLSMLLLYILGLGAILSPITIAAVYSKQGGWKYGFTFIQNSLEVGLFMSFSIAFLLACYHALSFEVVGKVPPANYLKTHQRVKVRGSKSLDEISDFARSNWKVKDIQRTEKTLSFRKPAIFMPADKVEIVQDGDLFSIKSAPFAKFWLLDFARNFKTVSSVGKFIKSKQ